MSKKKRYLPPTDSGRESWLKNLASKLSSTTYSTKFSLTKAQTDGATADSMCFSYGLALVKAASTFEQQTVSHKDAYRNGPVGAIADTPIFIAPPNAPLLAVAPGIFVRICELVQLIKKNKNYSEDIGRDLGIIGVENAVSSAVADELKVIITAKQAGGKVVIKYVKGKVDGIMLECKRGNETVFTLVDKITKNTFSDSRPNLIAGQAEARQYRAWCIIKDEIVGVVSNVIIISVDPQ